MSDTRNYLDFEIIKEPWNVYNLRDGSKLKIRVILESAWYFNKDGKKNYSVNIKFSTIMLCDVSLQGSKNQTKWTKEQLAQNIEVENCQYDTLSYEANEYILDDTTRILIHTNLSGLSRTKLCNTVGDRIYIVNAQESIQVTPPKQ